MGVIKRIVIWLVCALAVVMLAIKFYTWRMEVYRDQLAGYHWGRSSSVLRLFQEAQAELESVGSSTEERRAVVHKLEEELTTAGHVLLPSSIDEDGDGDRRRLSLVAQAMTILTPRLYMVVPLDRPSKDDVGFLGCGVIYISGDYDQVTRVVLYSSRDPLHLYVADVKDIQTGEELSLATIRQHDFSAPFEPPKEIWTHLYVIPTDTIYMGPRQER